MLLAGAFGLVAALVTVRAAAGAGAGGAVLVAAGPLPAGALIAPADLAATPVPEGLRLAGLLRDPAQALGRRTTAPVLAGEPLTEAALGGAPGLGPAPLAPGERAVLVPLAAAGAAAAAILPGSRVDAVASTGEGPAGRSEVVVADAEVLAVGAAPEGLETVEPGSVLLRVSARAALRLTEALNFAREVRLLVRPAAEAGPQPAAPAAPAP
jgi:Flp pilus assembly protein CpaB